MYVHVVENNTRRMHFIANTCLKPEVWKLKKTEENYYSLNEFLKFHLAQFVRFCFSGKSLAVNIYPVYYFTKVFLCIAVVYLKMSCIRIAQRLYSYCCLWNDILVFNVCIHHFYFLACFYFLLQINMIYSRFIPDMAIF